MHINKRHRDTTPHHNTTAAMSQSLTGCVSKCYDSFGRNVSDAQPTVLAASRQISAPPCAASCANGILPAYVVGRFQINIPSQGVPITFYAALNASEPENSGDPSSTQVNPTVYSNSSTDLQRAWIAPFDGTVSDFQLLIDSDVVLDTDKATFTVVVGDPVTDVSGLSALAIAFDGSVEALPTPTYLSNTVNTASFRAGQLVAMQVTYDAPDDANRSFVWTVLVTPQ